MQRRIELFWLLASLFFSISTQTSFNVTAIGARNNRSTLECWQLATSFSLSDTPGVAGSVIAELGDVATLGLTVIPSHFDGGLHNAPTNQLSPQEI